MREGSCQGVADRARSGAQRFVSADITAEEHVRMQAALQALWIIRFPRRSTSRRRHRRRCGHRLPAGLEAGLQGHHRLRDRLARQGGAGNPGHRREEKQAPAVAAGRQLFSPAALRKPSSSCTSGTRPRSRARARLPGYTYSIETPLGKAFVTINENGGDQPFEVFINTAKAGSDTAAVSEAIGRLISYILRLASPVAPRERLQEVCASLAGIGGGRSLGFGPNRVRSLPDGVAQVQAE
jgi:ribonucleoside-diphosphate reductase alpha chain